MKIISLEPVAGRGDEVLVQLTGGERARLGYEIVLRAGLREGDELERDDLDALQREDLFRRARETALRFLAHRARTAVEVARRLRRAEFPFDVIEACLSDLGQRGLVNDAGLAQSFTQERVRAKPRGARRIVQELRARGVAEETAGEAVSEILAAEGISELELARGAAATWRPREGEDRQRARRRLHGFLTRRGFAGETIRAVLAERLP